MRIGIGWDLHPLTQGRKFILGGVEIPFHQGLQGHSDGDLLSHAIADALLGAAGLSDIGCHFPDTDSHYKDISSLRILSEVKDEVLHKGYRLINIDSVIVCQAPRLKDYTEKMKEKLSEVLGISKSQIGIKAKTAESLGIIGEGRAVMCWAVALIEEYATIKG
jgi:2-C-methyl-D-erythritol 2,4-cyclodiphosphate synthase